MKREFLVGILDPLPTRSVIPVRILVLPGLEGTPYIARYFAFFATLRLRTIAQHSPVSINLLKFSRFDWSRSERATGSLQPP